MRRWNLLVAAGAVAIALIVAAVARAGPPGWIFGPAPTQANVTFQTDSGQPAFYEVITSPQPITGLTCPGGAHAVFPFNGNLDVGECGPFPGPGLSSGLILVTGANPFVCTATFGNQASFDSSTYTAQKSILSLNSCQTTPPVAPTPTFSSHASFQNDLRPQLTKQWNAFVEQQLAKSTSLNVGYVQAKTTSSGTRIIYNPGFWNLYVEKNRPPGAIIFPFAGTLSGPGMVQISIVQHVSTGHCAWLTSNMGVFRAGPCSGPIWLPTVTKGHSWSYIDRRAFAPGNYSVEVRAADQGKTETVFGAGIHNLMQVRVLLHH